MFFLEATRDQPGRGVGDMRFLRGMFPLEDEGGGGGYGCCSERAGAGAATCSRRDVPNSEERFFARSGFFRNAKGVTKSGRETGKGVGRTRDVVWERTRGDGDARHR